MKNVDKIGVTKKQLPALEEFERVVEERATAKRRYREAVKKCIDAGISNVRMASVAGVSETAIRMYRKRNNLNG